MHAPKFLAPVTALDACPRGPEGRGGGGGSHMSLGNITAAVPTQVTEEIKPLLFPEHCLYGFISSTPSHSPVR